MIELIIILLSIFVLWYVGTKAIIFYGYRLMAKPIRYNNIHEWMNDDPLTSEKWRSFRRGLRITASCNSTHNMEFTLGFADGVPPTREQIQEWARHILVQELARHESNGRR